MDANRPTRNWYHFGGMAIFVVSFFFFFLGQSRAEREGLVRDMWASGKTVVYIDMLSVTELTSPCTLGGFFSCWGGIPASTLEYSTPYIGSQHRGLVALMRGSGGSGMIALQGVVAAGLEYCYARGGHGVAGLLGE